MGAFDTRLARGVAAGAAVCSAAALLGGCTGSSVMDLAVGDCLQLPTESTAVTIDRASCTSPHQAEVSALVDTRPADAGADFPGEDVLNAQAETACVESFEGYVGSPYISSSLDVTWFVPTKESWKQGDRQIVCLVHALDSAPLTQPVKDSKL